MRLSRPVLLLLLAVLSCSSTFSQQSPPQRDPVALQLLNQAFLLMGGPRKAQVADVRVEGTLALPSAPDLAAGTFLAKARGWDISIDTVRGADRTSYRILGGRGSLRRNGDLKWLPPHNTGGTSLDSLPLFSRWTDFLSPNATITSPQLVTLDGLLCQLIHFAAQDTGRDFMNEHGKVDVLLDSNTGLVAAIRYRVSAGPHVGDQVQIENRFANYQDFGGFLLPTRITRYIFGRPSILLRVTAVRFNNGFSDADFQN